MRERENRNNRINSVRSGTVHNKMFTQWRVKFKFLVLSFKQRSVVADSLAFQIPPLRKHKRYIQWPSDEDLFQSDCTSSSFAFHSPSFFVGQFIRSPLTAVFHR